MHLHKYSLFQFRIIGWYFIVEHRTSMKRLFLPFHRSLSLKRKRNLREHWHLIHVFVAQLLLHALFGFLSALCKWLGGQRFWLWGGCHKQASVLLKLIIEQHKASIITDYTAQAHYVVSLISLHEESTQTLAKTLSVLQPEGKVQRNSIIYLISARNTSFAGFPASNLSIFHVLFWTAEFVFSSMALWMAMSACQSTTFVQTEMSQHLLDGLPWRHLCSHRVNWNNFFLPLTLHLLPSSGQNLNSNQDIISKIFI